MGSVSGEMKCPNCGSENCFYESYYKTGEESVLCPDCGFKHVLTLKRDENGDIIFKDESKGICDDNVIVELEQIKNPFGAYLIENSEGGSVSGSLENEEKYNEFREYIEEVRPDSNIINVIVRRYVDRKFITEKI
jgi:uncharacterized Zn finger protein